MLHDTLVLSESPVLGSGSRRNRQVSAQNPLLGSERLNTWGLHKKRVQLAADLAAYRRAKLAHLVDRDQQAFFDENGYFLVKNFLPEETFRQLKEEVFNQPFESREMRQGQAVTRMTLLPPEVLRKNAALAQAVRDPRAINMIRYAASQGGQPLNFIQTVLVEPLKVKKKIRSPMLTPIRFTRRPRPGYSCRTSARKTGPSSSSRAHTSSRRSGWNGSMNAP